MTMRWMVVFAGFWLSASAGAAQVGLVLDKGGKDDKSFNASAFLGATAAQKKLGFELKTVEAPDDHAFETLLRSLARRKMDLIISIGFAQADALKKIAAQFPDQKFAIVDAEVTLPNVRTLLFEEHEGSYLVGAIAALKSKSGKVGFIGGMDVPLIRRFEMGYVAGAKAVNPKVQILSHYVGVTASAWNNPPKAKELALTQFSQGADVTFAAAGASGVGAFDAAEEKKKFAIGVDSNQNWMRPGVVLTSMLKRVDVAVQRTIEEALSGKFSAGTVRYGLANEGVDFAIDEHNRTLLDAEILKRIAPLKAAIVAGKTKVPDYYLNPKR